MSWVWEHSNAEPTDRLVLLAIADCANDSGSDAYPSFAKLASKTGLHPRSVQRSVTRLVEIGELEMAVNAGPRGCNRYRVTMKPGKKPGKKPTAQRRNHGTETYGTAPLRHSAVTAESPSAYGTAPPPIRQTAVSAYGTAPPEPSSNRPRTILEPSNGRTTAQTIIGEWIDHCKKRPPERVIGPMAKQVAALLGEGYDPDEIRRGIAQWMTKDLSPSLLPSIVNSLVNGTARASPRKPSTTDSRVDQALALAAELERGEIEA